MAYDKTALSAQDLQDFLARHPGWKHEGKAITRTFEFPTFPRAIGFVQQVSEVAERHNHHPDIDIRYTKVTLRLTSHDAGGLTSRDPQVASECDRLA